MIFETISKDKLAKIEEMITFFLKKDFVHKFWELKVGVVLEVYRKSEYPQMRIGNFSIEQVIFVILPRLLQKRHVMYAPDMLERHVEALYEEFEQVYINKSNKTEELCQKDSDSKNNNSNDGWMEHPNLP